MASELPKTILLSVATSLDTRLVVVPLRTETIAGIRATIKDYHMSLFPDIGEVDVSSVEVQLFGAKSRLADPILIGQLFYNDLKASLFAELTVQKVSMPRDRSNFVRSAASDGQLAALSPGTRGEADEQVTVCQDPKQNFTERPSKRKLTEPVSDDGDGSDSQSLRRRHVGDVHSQARKEKSGETGIVSPARDVYTADTAQQPTTVGDAQTTQMSAVKVDLSEQEKTGNLEISPSQSSEKDVAMENVLVIDLSQKSQADKLKVITDSPAAVDVSDGAQSGSHSDQQENAVHGGPLASPSKSLGKDSLRDPLPANSSREQGVVKESTRGDKAGHVGSEVLQRDAGLVSRASSEIDLVVRSLLGMEPAYQDANDGPMCRSVSGDGATKKLKKSHKASPVAASKESTRRTSIVAISTPKSDSRVQSVGAKAGIYSFSKMDGNANQDHAHSTVPAVSVLSPRVVVTKAAIGADSGNRSWNSSGQKPSVSTSSESEERTKDSKRQTVDMPFKEPQNNESSSGKVGPDIVDLPGDNEDEESGSESDSSEQSTSESQSHDQGSSSEETDATESLPPIASRTRSRGEPVDGIGSKRRSSQRTVGGPLDSKYQHLLDSQDGFDELINLNQQNVQVVTGRSEDLKSLGQPCGSGVPTRAEDESDRVGKSSDLPIGKPDATETIARGRKDKSKADMRGKNVVENLPISNPVLSNELTMPEHLQEKHAIETLGSKSRAPSSEEAAEGKRQDPAPNLESLSKRNSDPDQESPRKGSEDLLQIKAAEQLARMSVPDCTADDPEIGPNFGRKKRPQRISSEPVSQMQGSVSVVNIAGDEPSPKHLALSRRSSDAHSSDERVGNAGPFEYRDLRSSHMATAYKTVEKNVDVKTGISPTRPPHRDIQVPSVSSHEEPASGTDMQDNGNSEGVSRQDNHQVPDEDHDKRASAKLGGTGQKRQLLTAVTRVGHVGKERKSRSVGKVTEDTETRMSGGDAESIPHTTTELDRNGGVPDVFMKQESAVPGPDEDGPSTELPVAHRSEDIVVTDIATEKKRKKRKSSVVESAEDSSKLKSPSRKKAPDESRKIVEPTSTDQLVRVDPSTVVALETDVGKLDEDKAVDYSQNNIHIQEKGNGVSVVWNPKEKKRSSRKSEQAAIGSKVVDVLKDKPLSPSLNRKRKSKSSKSTSDNDTKRPECSRDEKDIHSSADIAQNEEAVALGDEHWTSPRQEDTEVLRSNADDQAKTKKRVKSKTPRNKLPKVVNENGEDNEQDAGGSKVPGGTGVQSGLKKRRSHAEVGEQLDLEDRSRRPGKVKSVRRRRQSDEDRETGLSPIKALNLNLEDSPAKRVKRRRQSEEDKQNLSDAEHAPGDKEQDKAHSDDLDWGEDFQDVPTPDEKQTRKRSSRDNRPKSRASSPLEEPVSCPYGCGKFYSKKSSTYFRHRKQCTLAPP